MKQETLEEVAERLYPEDIMWGMDLNEDVKKSFITGYKLALERFDKQFKSTEKENYIETDKNHYQEINDIVHENQGNLGDITDEIYQWFNSIIKIR